MKFRKILHIVIISLLSFVSNQQYIHGQAGNDSTTFIHVGYKDNNHDGVNDLFHDANGDGKNEVTNLVYQHTFSFEDKNADGVNDVWQDKDGDGVNDMMMAQLKKHGDQPKTAWIDKDGDGIQDANVKPKNNIDLTQFVMDYDQDGKNDITGIEIDSAATCGYRYGYIDEENDKEIKNFTDKNNDGMHDKFSKRWENDITNYRKGRQFDYFIDTDGDGISDGRGFGKYGKHKTGRGYGRKKN